MRRWPHRTGSPGPSGRSIRGRSMPRMRCRCRPPDLPDRCCPRSCQVLSREGVFADVPRIVGRKRRSATPADRRFLPAVRGAPGGVRRPADGVHSRPGVGELLNYLSRRDDQPLGLSCRMTKATFAGFGDGSMYWLSLSTQPSYFLVLYSYQPAAYIIGTTGTCSDITLESVSMAFLLSSSVPAFA